MNTPSLNIQAINKRKKIIKIIITSIISIGLLLFIYSIFIGNWQTTDDAYVNGNQVILSSQVPGTIVAIHSDNTEWVETGQTLIVLDPIDNQLVLESAKQNLAQSLRDVRQLFLQAEAIEALIEQRKFELEKAKEDYNRRVKLLAKNLVSPEEVSHLQNAYEQAKSALKSAQKQGESSQALVDGLSISTHPKWLQACANFKQAYLNAVRTIITAPVSGVVGRRSAQVGQKIGVGDPLLTIIPPNEMWIDANFKETQLPNIKPGQLVEAYADIYGKSVKFLGKVVGLNAATGSVFSLLPAQNASGNWIKVVQRVPVKIAFEPKILEKNPLKLGLSMNVNVNTKSEASSPTLIKKEKDNDNYPIYQTSIYEDVDKKANTLIEEIFNANYGKNINNNNYE
ncbi:MAG: HlyD family secretion protein [Francisellaceae bacterium]|nr:HlyD family secretion protein [Francisellaceae bacterium]